MCMNCFVYIHSWPQFSPADCEGAQTEGSDPQSTLRPCVCEDKEKVNTLKRLMDVGQTLIYINEGAALQPRGSASLLWM